MEMNLRIQLLFLPIYNFYVENLCIEKTILFCVNRFLSMPNYMPIYINQDNTQIYIVLDYYLLYVW